MLYDVDKDHVNKWEIIVIVVITTITTLCSFNDTLILSHVKYRERGTEMISLLNEDVRLSDMILSDFRTRHG